MAASRWRTWEMEFHETAITPNAWNDLFCTNQVIPVGTHTFKLNIPANLLSLPRLAHNVSNVSSVGRGRGRKAVHDVYKPKFLNQEESIKEFAERVKNSNILSDQEWPSLCEKSREANNKLVHKQSKNTTSIIQEEAKTFNTTEDITVITITSINHLGTDMEVNETTVPVKGVSLDNSCHMHSKSTSSIIDEEQNPSNTKEEKTVISTSLINHGTDIEVNETIVPVKGVSLDNSNHIHVKSYSKENDFSNLEFLKTLSEPSKYVLIENLPLEFDEMYFQETILSFGAIETFKLQVAEDGQSMKALVKMENESHSVWVLSCLDGSTELCENRRLHVEKVDDMLGLTEELFNLSFE